MNKLSEKQGKILGEIGALQTLLERYPTFTASDAMLTNASINTSVGFLMDVLTVFGVSYTDMIQWVARMLSGDNKGNDGFLNVVEHTIKGIIFANIKDIFTCSINPILPDCLMKYSNPEFPDGVRPDPCDMPEIIALDNFRKIEIDLNQIDMFGILSNCPTDLYGSSFYFDTYDSIYEKGKNNGKTQSQSTYTTLDELREKVPNPQKGEVYTIQEKATSLPKYYYWNGTDWDRFVGTANYSPNTVWKSCDFNAFLWYVINKGTISNLSGIQRSTWDNRVQKIKTLSASPSLREQFFDISNCTGTTQATQAAIDITDGTDSTSKKQIIICEFEERPTPVASETNVVNMPSSNILRVWLNANRYYRTNVLKSPKDKTSAKLELNKTVFEFNYDYLWSMKLFDTKTLITQIMNTLLGFTGSISASLSVEAKITMGQVGEMVRRVISADDASTDDTVSHDCYFKFSNAEYDALLQKAMKEFNGREINPVTTENAEAILDAVLGLRQSTEEDDEVSVITRTIENFAENLESAKNATYSDDFKFSWGCEFITNFIQTMIEQIVLQVLTPKVALIYLINGAIMGNKEGDIQSWKDFLDKWPNVLFNIIKTVKNLLLEELYKFVIEQLKPILELLVSKLALETVKYYRDLILQLKDNCIPMWTLPLSDHNTVIDNVNYADITNEQTQPKTNNC